MALFRTHPVSHHYTLMEMLRDYYLIQAYPVQFFLEISLIIIAMILWIFMRYGAGPIPCITGVKVR